MKFITQHEEQLKNGLWIVIVIIVIGFVAALLYDSVGIETYHVNGHVEDKIYIAGYYMHNMQCDEDSCWDNEIWIPEVFELKVMYALEHINCEVNEGVYESSQVNNNVTIQVGSGRLSHGQYCKGIELN